jgi:alpha-methylacyl-CoA racemase
MSGPLENLRVVEIASIGPGPFAAMLLADMGADVLRVDRIPGAGKVTSPRFDPIRRGRRSVAIDLQQPEGAAAVLRLVEKADILIEGFRPGVAERLGIGPEPALARNPQLVYGRMTGWGQEGPYAAFAGHDINYIAVAGALEPIGRVGQAPLPPLNLVADYGGGGMLLAFGVMCAVHEARRSGKGQVVDAAMVDGAALLMTAMYGRLARGEWRAERGTNILDTGAHFYEVYETADHRYMAVGAVEPQFYKKLTELLGVATDPALPAQMDREHWPVAKEIFAAAFRTRTRDEWCTHFQGTDVCVAPVLTMAEAISDPHNQVRQTFVEQMGHPQPAPAPRFSRTPASLNRPPPTPGEHTNEVLREWGFADSEILSLRAQNTIG